ncbi:MAG: lipid asymmetry maintenance ABC transporter permease subunit MlaE [Gammaproteobacteria bacterium]|nr:lipid asymmetry maintenance ABC transporter permease subunit MlaE [Gammaproteobacteria bacterium]
MINLFASLGRAALDLCANLGRAGIMLVLVVVRRSTVRHSFRALITQLYSVGVLSVPIIIVSGAFIGMVVGLQGHHTLEKFGATEALGQLVALSVVRELGPVVAALLFAGRACSALTAEIGLMKTTNQLARMEMMGVDPLGYVIAPRFWAGVISLPLLTIIFDLVAIWGGYIVTVKLLNVDGGTFWSNMQANVQFYDDVLKGLFKSVVFGIVATWVAVYQGNQCVPTAEGIGRATTNTVVYASLAILGLDFILTAVILGGW